VVNKYDKKNSINTKRIQDNVKIPILATIERDDEAALQAANLGIPLAIFKKNSPVITNISTLKEIVQKKLDELDIEDRVRLFSQR
jgi:Flp pilus assembly CpaE family ATPase